MKITVLGDETTVRSFQLIGVEGTAVPEDTAPDELLGLLNEKVSDEDTGLIVVTRFIQKALGERFDPFLTSARPLVFVVPDTDEEVQEENLNRYIQQVIGIKL